MSTTNSSSMTPAELTVAQDALKARLKTDVAPAPIIVTVRRDGTRCFVQHPGESEALSQYIVVQALVSGGSLHSEQCDSEGSFTEWQFAGVRQASRFARELQGFEAPAIDSVESWSEALRRQFENQLASTWEPESEAMERIRKIQEEQ